MTGNPANVLLHMYPERPHRLLNPLMHFLRAVADRALSRQSNRLPEVPLPTNRVEWLPSSGDNNSRLIAQLFVHDEAA